MKQQDPFISRMDLDPFTCMVKRNYLTMIRHSMSCTIDELKEKRPNFDTARMEQAMTELDDVYMYIQALHNNAMLESKRNTDLTLINLQLIAENREIKKEMDKYRNMYEAGV